MSKKESHLSKSVRKILDKQPKTWFFIVQAFAIRGIPDVIGVCNGRFFAMELKKDKAESRKTTGRIVLQKYILDRIEKAGGLSYLVYPDILDEVILDLRSSCNL